MRNFFVLTAAVLMLCAAPAGAQKLTVTFDRGSKEMRSDHSYVPGVASMALDLTAAAKDRHPVVVRESGVDLSRRFSAAIWVKTPVGSLDREVIFSVTGNDGADKGFFAGSSGDGSWYVEIAGEKAAVTYNATFDRQPLNDGKWHLVGMSYDSDNSRADFFYDGLSVASYNTAEAGLPPLTTLFLGGRGASEADSFNGYVDNFVLYDQLFSSDEMLALYMTFIRGVRASKQPVAGDSIRFMTFDVAPGGALTGNLVGPQRIAEVIEASGADVVGLVNAGESGPVIADRLGFYLYRHSAVHSIVSRYPILNTYDLVDPAACAAVTVDAGKRREIHYASLWLPQPLLGGISALTAMPAAQIEDMEAGRAGLLEKILHASRDLSGIEETIVVSGGFGSGSHLDWTVQYEDMHNGLTVRWPATVAMEGAGYRDSYRELYPSVRDFPGIPGNTNIDGGKSYRKDFIFYKGGLEPVRAAAIGNHPVRFPSNSAAVMTTFKFGR